MALLRTISTEWGVTVPDAYCRVEAVLLSTKNSMQFHVRSYTAEAGVPFFKEEVLSCQYAINGENPIQQAYEHLKTLPEFEGAEDC